MPADRGARAEAARSQGVREWIGTIDRRSLNTTTVATFDTRVCHPRLPGSAPRAARRRLRRLGASVVPPTSFWVTGAAGPLVAGELDRARQWGEELAAAHTPRSGNRQATTSRWSIVKRLERCSGSLPLARHPDGPRRPRAGTTAKAGDATPTRASTATQPVVLTNNGLRSSCWISGQWWRATRGDGRTRQGARHGDDDHVGAIQRLVELSSSLPARRGARTRRGTGGSGGTGSPTRRRRARVPRVGRPCAP